MKLKNFFSKHNYLFLIILSCLIPIFILLIRFLYTYIKIKSFNPVDLFFGDASTQYNSFFLYLKDVLDGKQSLIYSFSKNMGGGMLSTYAYYLSSPLNLLVKFFDRSHLSLFFICLVCLKISLCGMTMFIYLKNKLNKLDYRLLIFSSAYSLMSYNICYYFNIMWLDIVFLTPLVLLGIDNLFKKDNVLLYVGVLSLAIFSNFYIAFMLCIFIVIYFIYNYIINYKDLKKSGREKKIVIKFLFFSILSASLCSIILLPTIIDFKNFSRYSYSDYKSNYNLFYMLFSKLYIGTHSITDSLSRNTPNIYFGTLPLILSIFYFFNKNIPKKNRILSFVIVLIFIISFCCRYINLLWHGGSFPNGYVFRFSFLFSFWMILLAAIQYYNMNKIKFKTICILFISYIAVGIVSQYYNSVELNYFNMYIGIFFLIIYLFLLSKDNKYLNSFLLLVFILELTINLCLTMFFVSDFGHRIDSDNLSDFCKIYEKFKDKNHRIDNDYSLTSFDSLMCNSNMISGYTSTSNGDIYNITRKLGMNSNYTGIKYNSQVVLATLFGINYEFTSNNIKDEEFYELSRISYFNNTDLKDKEISYAYEIYKLKQSLSIGYLILNNYNLDKNLSAFEYQNNIIKNFTNTNDNVYNIIKLNQKKKFNYTAQLDNSSKLYIYLKNDPAYITERIGDLYINNQFIGDYKYSKEGVITISNSWKNQKINIEFDPNKKASNEYSLSIATLNKDTLKKAINILQKNQLNVTKIEKNILEGVINVNDNNHKLFLSVPYEKEMNVYVDGKKVTIKKALDSMITLDINKGKHNIKLIFTPPGYYLGIIISIISAIILFIYFRYKLKQKIH